MVNCYKAGGALWHRNPTKLSGGTYLAAETFEYLKMQRSKRGSLEILGHEPLAGALVNYSVKGNAEEWT